MRIKIPTNQIIRFSELTEALYNKSKFGIMAKKNQIDDYLKTKY